MSKVALITGITGQDGSYLAEFLLAKDYTVHGIIRRSSSFNTGRIDHLYQEPWESGCRLFLHRGDMTDAMGLAKLVNEIQPDEIYNLACQSHVAVSFEQPVYTFETVANGMLHMLEAIRMSGLPIRYYQASSSEMFGSSPPPQNEETPFHPCSPYACGKIAAYHMVRNYRESYGMHASNGVLFNHESPRRGETFLTRKVTRAATRIKLGLQNQLLLGYLDSKRDWGFAGDYVRAMWLMLQQDQPDDYVIATGEMHSVRDFLDSAFGQLDLNWKNYVMTDDQYIRPKEVNALCGDATKAKEVLGWEPECSFDDLVRMMVESDLELARQESILAGA